MRYALMLMSLLVTMTAYADDTSSIDSIVNAYYEVVSGPEGFIYDADRDANIHADDALITKVFPDGRFQRHDLSAEQAMISVPYDQAFFESEVDRRIERYGNIAHVWSEFEMRTAPEAEPYSGGFNSISLYFKVEGNTVESTAVRLCLRSGSHLKFTPHMRNVPVPLNTPINFRFKESLVVGH